MSKNVDQMIAAAIASVGRSTKAVQAAAVAVLMHAEAHRDYRKANDLVAGIKASCRAESLVAWFKKFGGFTVSEGASEFDGWSGSEYIRERFQDAKATGWETVKKASNPYAFNWDDAVAALIRKAETAQKKAAADPELAKVISLPTQEQVKALKALRAA